jgi:glycosyltransferase involved in cell wall biosynthesis
MTSMPPEPQFAANSKQPVIIVGPTPPPTHGVAVLTALLLESRTIRQDFEIIHIDTSDRRGLENIGRFEIRNALLAIQHAIAFNLALLRSKEAICYFPNAQNLWGFLRDALFLLPARFCRRSVIVHFHGAGFQDFYHTSNPVVRWLVRLSLTRVARVLVLAPTLEGQFSGIISPERVRVVTNGIPDPFGELPVRASNPPVKTVLHLTNLGREKGIFEVLEVARYLRDRSINARIQAVGCWLRPTDQRDALAFVAEHGLEDYVVFPGPAYGEDKWRLFREADVFLFPPSGVEGMGLVLLEAMAAALPIVAAAQGGILDAVSDQVNAELILVGDTPALCQAVERLLADSDARLRMGQASRRLFKLRFSADRWTADIATQFREVSARWR